MKKLLLVLALTAPCAAPALASEQTDVMVPVHQYVVAFNKGDAKAASANCADETSIIDDFPPHEWHGAGACAAWENAFDADARKNGITEPKVTLGKARHVDVTGDRAYVVVAANFTYKQNGKPMSQIGSTWTFALQKLAAGWRIAGWAWGAR